jgi:phenylalanyl-tRNA synthetase beta chain
MLFSGLEAIVNNQNRQQSDLKLFEFGKTYHPAVHTPENVEPDVTKLYDEPSHLTLFIAGQRWRESWRNMGGGQADFFTMKTFAVNVLDRLGIAGCRESEIQDEVFSFGIKYHRGPQCLVTLGKVQPRICKKMGIRGDVYYADFDWDALYKAVKNQNISFAELNKFPSVRRDLALVIGNSVKFADLAALARKVGKKLLKDVNLFDVFEDESRLGKGKKSYALSFTFEDPTRTLQDKEVDAVINELIQAFETKLDAAVRR